ncbi:MAG: efflux RND transporter periplasmic adaptor subunit [Candidatus Moraniibacteriota bacterium]|nr:MAG: efflux RND transporter periplasmic adaptor subunit [Candidatus Moranbacteria bacterium]
MTRTRLIITVLVVIALGTSVFWFAKRPSKTPEESSVKDSNHATPEIVTAKAKDLAARVTEERIPAIVAAENETAIVAQTSGTVTSVSFSLGKAVSIGTPLVRIADPASSVASKSGIRSDTIRQAEIDASLARKSYKEAKRLAEKYTNKESYSARDVAKLRLESAEVALTNALESSIVRSPASGTVIEKSVGVGSSVAPGTVLAKVASKSEPVVRFHVSSDTLASLELGQEISVQKGTGGVNGKRASITAISRNADPLTGKFPVEATLSGATFSPGTVVSVVLPIRLVAEAEGFSLALPLSAVTTSQEGSFFFIEENGKATKVPVKNISVSGESALVSADISDDANVIVESGATLEEALPVRHKE